MKIAIIELHINKNFNNTFYNDQEIGLAKALTLNENIVDVYKFIHINNQKIVKEINNKIVVYYIPSKRIGSNSLVKLKELKTDYDIVICFSDIQISVPIIYNWSIKNNIIFVPYVGTISSNSKSVLVRIFNSLYSKIIINIYKKCKTVAKTNYVKNLLNDKGVNNVEVLPVGLDFDLLNCDYNNNSIQDLRNKYGFDNKDNIILFVGKLEPYKSPLGIVDIFNEIYLKNNDSKLLIVGDGSLKDNLITLLKNKNLYEKVTIIPKINNKDIWELYRISNKFVSLNKDEIFGMSIMEAMYYELPVYSLNAPGPNEIIEDKESGYLFNDIEDMKNNIVYDCNKMIGINAHKRIEDKFNWKNFVNYIEKL